jgi:hypothetical protein
VARSLAPLQAVGMGRRVPEEHPQPATRVQFAAGAMLQPSATPTPLFEHEDDDEHEDDFDALVRAGPFGSPPGVKTRG